MSMINPAAVPMPGPMSQRSDLPPSQGAKRLPDAAYGEQKQFQMDQAGAEMAGSAKQGPEVIPLGAPTRRLDEPVTAGVNAGAGPGSEVLGLKSPVDVQVEDLTVLAKYMPLMAQFADSPESSGTTKAFIKYLRSQTG